MKQRGTSICVWTPDLLIPDRLLEAAGKVGPLDGLRKDGGVETFNILGYNVVACDGICPEHDDGHISYQYSLLLVIRNDVDSFVVSGKITPRPYQPVGTAIWLDIWKKHQLRTLRPDKPYGVWAALCVDCNKKISIKECDVVLKDHLAQLT